MNKSPCKPIKRLVKKGQTCFIAVSPQGSIFNHQLYPSAEGAISVYTDTTGSDPSYVLELQVTKVGVPLHKIDWDLS